MKGEYSFDSKSRLWYRDEYNSHVQYSDGSDIETRILNAVKNSTDVSVLSEELETHIFDWTSLCFLSKRRSNLLRPFSSLFKGKHILEVGCGAGPITRFLGECGAFVYAVEPSRRRASIAAERCRDLENVKIFCDDIESFEADRQFDGLVQVGVLEYATKFSTEKNAPLKFLERLRNFLTPEGFLITAIENQLGLKYFSGFAEDHVGSIMHGINNNYRTGEPTTWGRKELIALFEKAGFSGNELFLPYPDYKLPSLVIYPGFKERNSKLNINMENILSNLSYRDVQKNTPLFSLDKALPLIAANDLLDDLSNSFCLFSSSMPGVLEIDEANLFVLYNTERKKEYCKEILFKKVGDSMIVERNRLHPGLQREEAVISFEHQEPVYPGKLYSYGLVKIVNRHNWNIDEAGEWLRGWFACLKKDVIENHLTSEVYFSDMQHTIAATYIDAVPINLLADENDFRFIDREVDMKNDIEIGYLVFRAVYVSFSRMASIAAPDNPAFANMRDILYALFARLGYDLTEELLDQYCIWEAELASAVSPVKLATIKSHLAQLRVRPRLDSLDSLLHDFGELQSNNTTYGLDIERKTETILKLEEELGLQRSSTQDRDSRLGEYRLRIDELEDQIRHSKRQEEDTRTEKPPAIPGSKIPGQTIAGLLAQLNDQQELTRMANEHITTLETQKKQLDHEIYSLSTSRKRMIKQFIKRTFPFLFKE